MKVVSRFQSSDFDRPSLLLQSKVDFLQKPLSLIPSICHIHSILHSSSINILGCKVQGFESQVEEKITMTRARLCQRRGICEKIHITTWVCQTGMGRSLQCV
ncbi:uncharacterized protein LOC110923063 isoform X2 [Helianthus annuus]|uniref:uncharacterized protein LOC110923063 isoform X2 n=1 Tax=Helianthus annuus TaxID=4232 RepID=UPI0016532496|nr:uncharacterized protein LOC110923063 isoform X2 [Helianthus annuus]